MILMEVRIQYVSDSSERALSIKTCANDNTRDTRSSRFATDSMYRPVIFMSSVIMKDVAKQEPQHDICFPRQRSALSSGSHQQNQCLFTNHELMTHDEMVYMHAKSTTFPSINSNQTLRCSVTTTTPHSISRTFPSLNSVNKCSYEQPHPASSSTPLLATA